MPPEGFIAPCSLNTKAVPFNADARSKRACGSGVCVRAVRHPSEALTALKYMCEIYIFYIFKNHQYSFLV
jgi:hypothetical protein